MTRQTKLYGPHEAQPFWYSTITTHHDSNRVGLAQGLSWSVLELRYKPIGRYEHDPFTVDIDSTMLGTYSPSN